MKVTKDHVKTFVKLFVGAALVYYVLHSKMVDFESLKAVVWSPKNLLFSLILYSASAVCISVRWFYLIRAQGLSLSFKDTVALTMIGNFFNTFMPGAVGGDLIKAWYVAGKEPKRKTKAVFTVLLDRIIGLSVIIFYSATTLVFYYGVLSERKELQVLGISIWAFTLTCILFSVLFFTPRFWKHSWVQACLGLLKKFTATTKVLEAALLYQHHLITILGSLVISAVSIACTIVLWAIQGPYLGIEMGLPLYFFVVPLGLTASAIPLLPGGIGVGQVAFFTLFQWVGMSNPEQGGTLCTLMQIHMIIFSFSGALFYVRYKRKPNLSDSNSMNTSSVPHYTPRTTLQ